MKLFRCSYQSSNKQGFCFVFAKNKEEAQIKLLKKSILAINIQEFRLLQYGGKIYELEGIFWQLGFGYSSGLNLIVILESIKDGLHYKENILLLQTMINNLNNGNTLSDALKKHVKLCGNLIVSIFEIGEKSGFLQEICDICAKEIAYKNEFLESLYKALIYPCILGFTFILVFIILSLFVIPEFAQIYDDLNATLPFSTQLMLSVSSLINNYIFEIIAILCCFLLILYAIFKKKTIRDSILIRSAFIKNIIIDYELYVYFLGLHYFLKSQVPFETSIEKCNELIENSVLKNKFSPLIDMLNSGIPLSQALNKLDIQISNISLLQSGEKSGMLDKTLYLNSMFYKKRFSKSLQIFQILMQPISTIIMGLLITWIAFGIVSPMWQLLEIAM